MDGFIIMLREGIEIALVVGIMLAYLGKTGRTHLSRHVYTGLGAAVVFSLAMALVLKSVGVNAENELVEGVIYLTASVFVASMVVWMWKTGRQIKKQMEDKMAALTAAEKTGIAQIAGIFALTFLMVAREGIEIVLFFSALSLTATSQMLTVTGAAAGLLLAAAFGFAFAKGGLKIDLRKFFAATSAALLLLSVKFLAGGVHEFAEVGIVTMSERTESIITLVAKSDASMVIMVMLLVIPIGMAAYQSLKSRGAGVQIDPRIRHESRPAS